MLPPEKQAEILSLFFTKKMKVRAIARKLGVNRKSVERVLARRSVAIGLQPFNRSSILDPYKAQIESLFKEDAEMTGVVALQRIRDKGYGGGYTILQDWIKAKRLRESPAKEAFFKIDFPVGLAGQVDWGEFGDVFGDGIKIHCFVMVLCYSRLLYIEFTRSEKFEEFIRCHENAIAYFENLVPEQFWYDNLPAAVTERVGKLIRFNYRFLAYAGHHYFAPHACNKGKGNEKGRVEDGVKYIRSNFWPGRKFVDFEDLCRQAIEWRDKTANLREHRATRKIPRLIFDAEEKVKLNPANPIAYERDQVFSLEVRPDFHITYETNQYSVPWTLVGCVLTVRINSTAIKVFYNERFITEHSRCYLKYQKPFTKPEHEKGLLELKPQGKNAHLNWQIQTLESYGEPLKKYLECLQHSQRSLKKEISRLLALGTVYGEKELANAVDNLLKRGTIGADQVELLLKIKDPPVRPPPMNLSDSKLSRIPTRIDLRQYDGLLIRASTDNLKPQENTNGNREKPEDTSS
jgi:transposase